MDLDFCETVLLPLPYGNVFPRVRSKCWLRGGVGVQFPKNLNLSSRLALCITPGDMILLKTTVEFAILK